MVTPLTRSALVALVVAAAGCGDRDGSSAPPGASASAASGSASAAAGDGGPRALPSASASAAGASPRVIDGVDGLEPPPDAPADPLGAVGARMRTLTAMKDEPAIEANLALVTAHFGGAVPLPLELREVRSGGGRRALLVTGRASGGGDAARPLVLVVDAEGHVLWPKERPLAGTHERSRGLTITGGPEGAVLVFWWDVASRAVAGRRWGHDGSIFADFHFFDREDVTGLDALWWPDHGWIVTATSGGRAETALLLKNGFRGFGDRVLDVSGTHEVLAPAVAAAGTDGIFFAYVGRPRGAGATSARGAGPVADAAQPQIWATFRRPDGAPAWPAPVALGPAMAGDDGAWPRPRIELLTPARARVTAGATSAVIGSDGRTVTPPG